MTYEPSSEAVEAAYDHYHTGLEVGRERMATALTAGVPIELEQERKRWEEEIRQKLRAAIQYDAEGEMELVSLPVIFDTIFGPEEEGASND